MKMGYKGVYIIRACFPDALQARKVVMVDLVYEEEISEINIKSV